MTSEIPTHPLNESLNKYRKKEMYNLKKRSELHRYRVIGSVQDCSTSLIKAILPGAAIGQRVQIDSMRNGGIGFVTGFSNNLSSIICIDGNYGIKPGSRIRLAPESATISLPSNPLGLAISATGEILDGMSSNRNLKLDTEMSEVSLKRRSSRVEKFRTDIPVIDHLFPLALGQRILIAAEPGVGKTRLLSELAKSTDPDVIVFALIGERGREAKEFISDKLPKKIREKSIVVVSTSDEPAMKRVQSAHLACSLAEHFSKENKKVLLLMDSLTRLLRAERDVALASGETPVRRGYPASVFAELPKLLERAGSFRVGSITAFYTMLLNSELDEDPMLEEVKGIVDGHFILRRKIAERHVYPALSISESLSRLSTDVQSDNDKENSSKLRKLISRIELDRELALFAERLDPELDFALKHEAELYNFVRGTLSFDAITDMLRSS